MSGCGGGVSAILSSVGVSCLRSRCCLPRSTAAVAAAAAAVRCCCSRTCCGRTCCRRSSFCSRCGGCAANSCRSCGYAACSCRSSFSSRCCGRRCCRRSCRSRRPRMLAAVSGAVITGSAASSQTWPHAATSRSVAPARYCRIRLLTYASCRLIADIAAKRRGCDMER